MFTREHLAEEYRLPTKPEELKRRLGEIIKAHKRLYANTTNAVIKSKIGFLEEWENSIVIPPKNPVIAPSSRKKN